jgi:hypothetical protein
LEKDRFGGGTLPIGTTLLQIYFYTFTGNNHCRSSKVIFKTRILGPGVHGEGPFIETTKDQSLSLGEKEEITVSGTIEGAAFEGYSSRTVTAPII